MYSYRARTSPCGPVGIEQPEGRDARQLRMAVDGYAVAAVVGDEGRGAVVSPGHVDAAAVAVLDGGQPQDDGAGQSERRAGVIEDEAFAGPWIVDAHRLVRSAGPPQRPVGALEGQHGHAADGRRVFEAHSVGGGEHHTVPVQLQALVEDGGPGAAEPVPVPVGGEMGALHDERERAG